MNDHRYTGFAITLHWLVAAGIIVNLALPWIWPVVPDAAVRPVIDFHKSLGITVLGLAMLRLLWRVSHRPPPLPTGYKAWEVTLSHWTHIALYLIIFAMPITGWVMDSAWKDAAAHPMLFFGTVEWPRLGFIMALDPATKLAVHDGFQEAHHLIGWAVYALLALHIAGALKHQWFDRERQMQRMWY